jgi:hypothetical protein
MTRHRFWLSWLSVTAGVLWATLSGPTGTSSAQERETAVSTSPSTMPEELVEQMPPAVRDRVRMVVEKPTLMVQGPLETFHCQPPLYFWFLDHPDQGVVIWRRLGAKCMDLTDMGGGRFGWTDGKGSAVHWDTVYKDSRVRIWYAEGQARPAPLLAPVGGRAVVVLRYLEGSDLNGRPLIRHQADLFLQTDSKAMALVARLLGAPAHRLGEQGLEQMEMFFSALVWYLDRHPERASALLLGIAPVCPRPEMHGN